MSLHNRLPVTVPIARTWWTFLPSIETSAKRNASKSSTGIVTRLHFELVLSKYGTIPLWEIPVGIHWHVMELGVTDPTVSLYICASDHVTTGRLA